MQMIFVMGLVLVKGQVILVMSIYELTLSLAFLLPYENNIVVLYFIICKRYLQICIVLCVVIHFKILNCSIYMSYMDGFSHCGKN